MKLTKEHVKKMLPDQTLTIVCDNTAELDSAYQTALQARKEIEDFDVQISRSYKTMIVAIRIAEKGGSEK